MSIEAQPFGLLVVGRQRQGADRLAVDPVLGIELADGVWERGERQSAAYQKLCDAKEGSDLVNGSPLIVEPLEGRVLLHLGTSACMTSGFTFAARVLALGETLPEIGKLLSHNDIETTARYAHLAQDSIHEVAERIARSIAGDIL